MVVVVVVVVGNSGSLVTKVPMKNLMFAENCTHPYLHTYNMPPSHDSGLEPNWPKCAP